MVEQLGSRITPYTSRAIGTFQIKDMTVPTEWVSSPSGSVFGDVVGTHNLQASLDVTYTITGDALLLAQRPQGMTLSNEEVRWREEDTPGPDQDVSTTRYSITIKAPAVAVGTFSQTAVIRFPVAVTNDAWKDWWNDSEFYGWFDLWGPSNLKTGNIVLESVGAGGANTGGTVGNAALRPTSPSVTVTQVASLDSPALPILAAGERYKIFTFDSPDGNTFALTAANPTGLGLFTASSPALVQDSNAPDGDTILDQSTTFAGVYPAGAPYAGTYSGSNKDLVARDGTGETYLLTGYSYSKVPPGLLALPDGQTMPFPAELVEPGSDALWLTFQTPSGSAGFLITKGASTDPTLSISDTAVTEGNSGTTNATFTVSLSAPSALPVTVNYATSPGTAGSPADFTATGGTLTFQPGEVTKTIAVPVVGDTVYELDEDFFVNLGSPVGASIADGAGAGTILNDDAPPTLSIADVSQSEGTSGTTAFTFTVSLSAPSLLPVTVNYATADGTATTADGDYAAAAGSVTFNPGETSKAVTVSVTGDTRYEPDETFTVNLSNPTNATLADGQGQGTIQNDDAQPTITIDDVSQREGDSGTTLFVFTVTLSNPSWVAVTVDFATADGTATAGSDYQATSGTLTFQPGETTKTITVAVYGDIVPEGGPSPAPGPGFAATVPGGLGEDFFVNLSAPTNATLLDGQGLGFIQDDD